MEKNKGAVESGLSVAGSLFLGCHESSDVQNSHGRVGLADQPLSSKSDFVESIALLSEAIK